MYDELKPTFWIHDNPSEVIFVVAVLQMVTESIDDTVPFAGSTVNEEISMGCPHYSKWGVLPDVVDNPHPLKI